jgi:hypothetical protein
MVHTFSIILKLRFGPDVYNYTESRSANTCKIFVQFIGAANLVIMTIPGFFFVRLRAVYPLNKYTVNPTPQLSSGLVDAVLRRRTQSPQNHLSSSI